MALSSLSSTQIAKLVELVKEKEILQAKLAKVKRSIDSLEPGSAKATLAAQKRGPRRGRRRMKMKDALLNALEAAGKKGMSVKNLATEIKANPASVSVWFYTTGKKIKGLRKLAPAHYAYIRA